MMKLKTGKVYVHKTSGEHVKLTSIVSGSATTPTQVELNGKTVITSHQFKEDYQPIGATT